MTPPSLAAFDLTGKLAVVTGARRGIGLAIAEAMAAAGADIVAVSAHLEPSGSQVEARVAAHGRTCLSLAADFADRAAVRELASALADLGRPVDNPGEQRGHHRARAGRGTLRHRLGPGYLGGPQQPVRADP
jgi:2-deoxy-D-gluconate 3-dehydrogenase